MSDNFLYSELTEDGYTNQVTAEDLNNIAKDLGASEFSAFKEDGTPFAVESLNGITQALTSKGILLIGSCCAVSISDSIITVADGVCVFDNGAKKRITEPQTLTFIEGSHNYVYLLNNVTANQIQLITSTTDPAESEEPIDYVMLAEISMGKVVVDRRYWSISKVGSGVNIVQEYTMEFVFKPTYYNKNTETYETRFTHTIIDIPYGANFIVFNDTFISDDVPIAIPLIEGEEVNFYFDVGYGIDEKFIFKKEKGNLDIITYQTNGNKSNSVATLYRTLTFWVV